MLAFCLLMFGDSGFVLFYFYNKNCYMLIGEEMVFTK